MASDPPTRGSFWRGHRDVSGDSLIDRILFDRRLVPRRPTSLALLYVVLSRVTTKDSYDMVGDTSLREGLFQADCYSADHYGSRAVAKAVWNLLKSHRGTLPDTDSTKVQATFIDKDWDMPYQEGAKGFVFRALLHFRVHFEEA